MSSIALTAVNTSESKQEESDGVAPKSYGPFFLEYSLMAEYNLLQKQSLSGVYVVPSAKTPLLWFGVIFIRHGLYQSGIFKFCVTIPPTYPDGGCPQILFDYAPFHPLIHPKTGKLDVQRAFPVWKRNVNHVWNVLLYMRRIFHKIDTHAPINPEAAVLYQNKLMRFKEGVMKSIATSKAHLFDSPRTNDPHELFFTSMSESNFVQGRTAMLESLRKSKSASSSGMSWVESGTTLPFSKPHC